MVNLHDFYKLKPNPSSPRQPAPGKRNRIPYWHPRTSPSPHPLINTSFPVIIPIPIILLILYKRGHILSSLPCLVFFCKRLCFQGSFILLCDSVNGQFSLLYSRNQQYTYTHIHTRQQIFSDLWATWSLSQLFNSAIVESKQPQSMCE